MFNLKRPWHVSIGIIFFLILWGSIEPITITLIPIPIAMTIFPDVDAGSKYHRHFLTHSIIIWFCVWCFNPTILTALVCVGIGLHCICDITLYPSKWRGSYTIKFTNKGLNGKLSTSWLLMNFVGSIIILVIQILLFVNT